MRVLDLFSGIGGWTRGLHAAGYETVAACEIDNWKRAQYERLFPEVKVYNDIRSLNGAEIARDCGPIDFVAGSPPCKHISSARAGGQRGVDGDGLFFEAIRIVSEVRPLWFAFENSPHLRTRGADRVLAAIEGENYACWPVVVGACHAGTAHKRQRVWLMGRDMQSSKRGIAGQSRRSERVASYLHDVKRRSGAEGEDRSKANHGYSADFGIAERRFGPSGTQPLSSHIREYDGVPSRDAERARHAYGDAIVPQVATAIGRAIMAAEQQL